MRPLVKSPNPDWTPLGVPAVRESPLRMTRNIMRYSMPVWLAAAARAIQFYHRGAGYEERQ